MQTEPAPPEDDHGCDTQLTFAAAKLEVYRHERLANTEPPRKKPAPRLGKRKAALLKAMAAWALAHF